MNQIDFSNYKFRCSGLKHLMVLPKTKQARENGELSESTKTYLRDIYIKEVFGREKPNISTGATKKGTMVESDSLDLVQKVTGQTYFKNNKRLENDFIKGTPDVICKDDLVIDIKSNWDIWTFASVDYKKARTNYYYQVLGYMWLTGKSQGELDYCLVNTPEELISKELYKLSFSIPGLLEGGIEIENELRKNYIYDDIDGKIRLKKFIFDRSEEDIETLMRQIIIAREYLQTLVL